MKFALITFGNEESYGLLFVGGELLEHQQEIKFFSASPSVVSDVIDWNPDFICFSPMTTFFDRSLEIVKGIKEKNPHVLSIYGGHHAIAVPEIVKMDAVDIVVRGPVRGSISQILDGTVGLIKTKLTVPSDLAMPARDRYYADVPRMGKRYRKFMLSMLGCKWNCSYCSASCRHMRDIFGSDDHKRYYLGRRPLRDIIEEASVIISYPTSEIEWVDDDMFAGGDTKEWIPQFAKAWKYHVNKPIYISTTSLSVLKTSNNVLASLRGIVSVVGLGVQAARKESLRFFNRHWDSEEKLKAAYNRLRAFGFGVNLQSIVGLPVSDPVDEAMDTIKLMQRIGKGSICSVYPLQIYPGTVLEKYCCDSGILLNDACNGDTNSGLTGILFDDKTSKRLRNICKLATMFVKYGIDERWMRALIDVDFDDETSKQLSITRYHDCIVDRYDEKGEEFFNKIIAETRMSY